MTSLIHSLPWLLSLQLGAVMMASHCPARAGSTPAGLDLGSEPVTMTVAMPASVRSDIERAEAPARLEIEARRTPGASGVVLLGLRVFLDLPTANEKTSIDDPHFLGSMAFGQRDARDAAEPVERFTLPLAKVLEALGGLAELGDLQVTLVPEFHPDAPAPEAAATYARIESLRVTSRRSDES